MQLAFRKHFATKPPLSASHAEALFPEWVVGKPPSVSALHTLFYFISQEGVLSEEEGE